MTLGVDDPVLFYRDGHLEVAIFTGLCELGQLRLRPVVDGCVQHLEIVVEPSEVLPLVQFAKAATIRNAPEDPRAFAREMSKPRVLFSAGDVVGTVAPEGRAHVELFKVTEEVAVRLLEDDLDNVTVPLVRYDPRGNTIGDALERPLQSLTDVAAIVSRYRFRANIPRDRFIDVIIADQPRWSIEEPIPAQLRFGDEAFEGALTMESRDGLVHLKIETPRPGTEGAIILDSRDEGTLTAKESGPFPWVGTYVRAHVGGIGPMIEVSGVAGQLDVTYRDGAAEVTRELFFGPLFGSYAHKLLSPRANPWDVIAAANAYIVTIFGRDARIVQYDPKQNLLGIVYEGEPLNDEERICLTSFLFYITGTRGAHWTTERFTLVGERLSTTLFSRGNAVQNGAPPLYLSHINSTPAMLAERFDAMLAQFTALYRDDPNQLDGLMHSYFEGTSSHYPITRLREIGVAIDALAPLRIKPDRHTILPKQQFRRIRVWIDAAIGYVSRLYALPVELIERVKRNIHTLNRLSNAELQEYFWLDVAIKLTERERRALATRNPAVHRAHVRDERKRDDLLQNYEDSCVLVNLFNRAFLRMLGWAGPVRNAATLTAKDLERPIDVGNE